MQIVDVRSRNVIPTGDTIEEFAGSYFELLQKAQNSVDKKHIAEALQVVERSVRQRKTVYVAGNGGSAAIANHLCCDWSKGTFLAGHHPIKSHSLAANPSVLTALANDFSFEESFSWQIQYYVEPEDVVILISSSGNSPNILQACKAAREKGAKVIGMTGFQGGKLKTEADIPLHVECSNYGMVEDCHQSLMHIFAQYIARSRDQAK